MRRENAIAALKRETDAVKARGATALYLFGSTARDQATSSSDVDVFIDYARGTGFSLIEMLGIKHYLEDRLGVNVDLTTRDSLHPLLRKRIEESADRVF